MSTQAFTVKPGRKKRVWVVVNSRGKVVHSSTNQKECESVAQQANLLVSHTYTVVAE